MEAFGGGNCSGPIPVAAALNANHGCSRPGDFEAGTLLVERAKAAGQVRRVLAFDPTQVTHPENRSNPQLGDPSHSLASGQVPPTIISFSCADWGADVGELAPPLRAMGPVTGKANGGGQVAVAIGPRREAFSFQPRFARNDRGAPSPLAYPLTAEAGRTGRGDSQQCLVTWSLMPQNSGRDFKARQVDVAQPLLGCGPTSSDQGGDIVQQGAVVRRITPREAERLQGFMDDFTKIPWRGKPASQCPDSPRYRALGNSMAVPVMYWIGARIDVVHRFLTGGGHAKG